MVPVQAVFLITTSIKKPYFAALQGECQRAFFKRFADRLLPFFFFLNPGDDYGEYAAVHVLSRALTQFPKPRFLICVPTSGAHFATSLVQAIEASKATAIAFTLPFQEVESFTDAGLPEPFCIMSNNRSGGKMLGSALGTYLAKHFLRSDRIRVALIPGRLDRIDSAERIAGFKDGLQFSKLALECDQLEECLWESSRAQRTVAKYLNTGKWPDVIFAANDMMALGARSAVMKAQGGAPRHSYVCGYDAIDVVRSYIDEGDGHFWGSVNQNLPALADRLCETLHQLLLNPVHPVEKFQFVDPQIVVSSRSPQTLLGSRVGSVSYVAQPRAEADLENGLKSIGIIVGDGWRAIDIDSRSYKLGPYAGRLARALFAVWIEGKPSIERSAWLKRAGIQQTGHHVKPANSFRGESAEFWRNFIEHRKGVYNLKLPPYKRCLATRGQSAIS